MLSPTSLALHLPLSAFRACEGVHRQLRDTTWAASVKPASWIPTRALLALLVGPELVFGKIAVESVNGALKEQA